MGNTTHTRWKMLQNRLELSVFFKVLSLSRDLESAVTTGWMVAAVGSAQLFWIWKGFLSEAGNYCLATESSDECAEGSEAASKGSRVGSAGSARVCVCERGEASAAAPRSESRGLWRADWAGPGGLRCRPRFTGNLSRYVTPALEFSELSERRYISSSSQYSHRNEQF